MCCILPISLCRSCHSGGRVVIHYGWKVNGTNPSPCSLRIQVSLVKTLSSNWFPAAGSTLFRFEMCFCNSKSWFVLLARNRHPAGIYSSCYISYYSSSKLTRNLTEAAVQTITQPVTAKHGKTLKGNRQFKVLQQEELCNLCTAEYKALRPRRLLSNCG